MKHTSKLNFLLLILFVVSLEATLFFSANNKLNLSDKIERDELAKATNTLNNLDVESKSFSVYDATLNKKIYGKNDNTPFPLASITKIMTVIVALNQDKKNNKPITISLASVKQEGDYGIFAGEKFEINNLAKFTLIGSSNDGAYALSNENNIDFISEMNKKAEKLGMENTLFNNSTGLDINANTPGAYASAQDVNTMAIFGLSLYPEVFEASSLKEINIKSDKNKDHSIKNTDTILDKIPNILLSKTGFTSLAGGNLVIIYKNEFGHEIAITVLGSTEEGRFKDMEKIVNTLSDLKYGS